MASSIAPLPLAGTPHSPPRSPRSHGDRSRHTWRSCWGGVAARRRGAPGCGAAPPCAAGVGAVLGRLGPGWAGHGAGARTWLHLPVGLARGERGRAGGRGEARGGARGAGSRCSTRETKSWEREGPDPAGGRRQAHRRGNAGVGGAGDCGKGCSVHGAQGPWPCPQSGLWSHRLGTSAPRHQPAPLFTRAFARAGWPCSQNLGILARGPRPSPSPPCTRAQPQRPLHKAPDTALSAQGPGRSAPHTRTQAQPQHPSHEGPDTAHLA